MLHIGVAALGTRDVVRAAAFWCEALGYEPDGNISCIVDLGDEHG